jgi:hypothetical protein
MVHNAGTLDEINITRRELHQADTRKCSSKIGMNLTQMIPTVAAPPVEIQGHVWFAYASWSQNILSDITAFLMLLEPSPRLNHIHLYCFVMTTYGPQRGRSVFKGSSQTTALSGWQLLRGEISFRQDLGESYFLTNVTMLGTAVSICRRLWLLSGASGAPLVPVLTCCRCHHPVISHNCIVSGKSE